MIILIWKKYNKLGLSLAKLSNLFFKFGVGLVFAVKDRLSLRYGSVRNLLLKHNPNRIWEFRIWNFRIWNWEMTAMGMCAKLYNACATTKVCSIEHVWRREGSLPWLVSPGTRSPQALSLPRHKVSTGTRTPGHLVFGYSIATSYIALQSSLHHQIDDLVKTV